MNSNDVRNDDDDVHSHTTDFHPEFQFQYL